MLFHAALSLAMAAATWLGGWWGVAIVALAAGYLHRGQRNISWFVALAAANSWLVLWLMNAAFGPLRLVATTLAGAMSLPAPALVVLMLLFPALLGWSGAVVGSEVGQLLSPPARDKAVARA